MNTYVIVHLSNLSINTYYQSNEVNYGMFGGENGNPQASVHLPVPEGLTWDVVKGVAAEDGTVTLQTDPAKVAAKEAQAWTQLRTERNARLAACDWTQLQDAHLSAEKKSAWADYRQALRDLPDEVQDLDAVEWPQINTPS
jgi:hypothetical protein